MDIQKLREFAKTYQAGAGSLSCANFVSSALKYLGYKIPVVNVTTDLWKYTKKRVGATSWVGNIFDAGDIVFFSKTYDALPPYEGSPGKEDTYTHVGIATGGSTFIHYSSSQGKPVEISCITNPFHSGAYIEEIATVLKEYEPTVITIDPARYAAIHVWKSSNGTPLVQVQDVMKGSTYLFDNVEFRPTGMVIKLKEV